MSLEHEFVAFAIEEDAPVPRHSFRSGVLVADGGRAVGGDGVIPARAVVDLVERTEVFVEGLAGLQRRPQRDASEARVLRGGGLVASALLILESSSKRRVSPIRRMTTPRIVGDERLQLPLLSAHEGRRAFFPAEASASQTSPFRFRQRSQKAFGQNCGQFHSLDFE
jgi:hypothetical protein